MTQIPDHPAIRQIERCGYAAEPQVFGYCDECGDEIYVGEEYYDVGHGIHYCIYCGEKILRKEATL